MRLISTTARTDALPRRWPSVRLLPLSLAQRPLPSMMMATCLGNRLLSRPLRFILGGGDWAGRAKASDLHNLVLFGLQHLVYPDDELIGDLLDSLLALFKIVCGNLLFLFQLL